MQDVRWPDEGVRRIPYAVYSKPEVYEAEQRAIFRGPIWHFLGLEAQIPETGNYVLAQVGETSVIVVREASGGVNALVNRCSHKGTPLVYTPSGKVSRFLCIYHNWCYGLGGQMISAAWHR